MKKNTIKALVVLCLLWSSLAQAQERRARGLVFDKNHYAQAVKTRSLDGVSGSKSNILRSVVSLRDYCPTPQNQGNEPSCAAWAIAYGAMTIHNAIHRKVGNTRDVDKIAHSKAFVFNQLCSQKPCAVGVGDILTTLITQGTCLAATFRNDVPTSQQPDVVAIKEATRFRLDSYAEAFDPDTAITKDRSIFRLKRLLADSTPVVIGIYPPGSFDGIGKDKWRLSSEDVLDTTKAHALCLIGYDNIDSTFEVMNSWGMAWGNGGFTKIHYTDLMRLLVCAYTIKPHFAPTNEQIELVLRKPLKYDTQTGVAQFEEVRVAYDSQTQGYRTLQKSWSDGASFQMALRSVPIGWSVYGFGLNPKGEIGIFHESIMGNAIEKILPSERDELLMEMGGTENMCVLVSKHPLSNFKEKIKKIHKSGDKTFSEQVKTVFSDVLLPNPSMMLERMGFTYPKETDKAMAIILSIN